MEVSQKLLAPLALSFALATGAAAHAKTHESDAHLSGDLSFSCDMPDLSHLTLEDRIENIIDANVFIQIGNGLGSGFVIDNEQGYIMTNNHVVEISERSDAPITVTLFDADEADNRGEQHTATLVGRDAVLDIAILKIDNVDNLSCVNMGDSDDVRLGQTVEAIGNPAGLSFSLSQGLVSNTQRSVGNNILYTFIQTDTAINRGNSGGALYNDAGEVVGINFSILSPNGFNTGLGFSIKSNDAIEVADEIIRTGEAQRASLGVNLAFISDSIAEELGLNSTQGARISRLEENGPAALAGLQENDIIREIDGEDVNEIKDARRIIGHLEPDDVVRIKVIRDRALQTIEVDFAAEPDPALLAQTENQETEQSANNDAPAVDIPAWDADGRNCQGVPEESLAEFLKDSFGNVYVEDGVREDGVLRLYADIQGDDIGQDDGSFSIVGHPFKQGNPDNGFNENITCLLGGGESGYPDEVLGSDWYREQFAGAAEDNPEEEVIPETPAPEVTPDTGPHPPGPQ